MLWTRFILKGATVGAVLSTSSFVMAQAGDRSGDPDIPKGMSYPEPHYYLDPGGGNDSASGKSESEAWASLSPASRMTGGTLYIKKGTSLASISPRGITVSTYGTGDRPWIKAAVNLSGNTMLEGLKFDGTGDTGITISGSGNVVHDCDISGKSGTFQLGFGVMGTGNLIIGNSVHDLSKMSGDSGDMNTSGGAEGYMIMGSNNEIAYNSAVGCRGPNKTLGGEEGGCYEIVNGKAGAVLEDVYFHHNYCESSVGLWEASSGNFSGSDKIQEHHGIIRNIYLAYNLSVDAMWLYLVQPVNTDFSNIVFEHNTLVHTAVNDTYKQQARNAFTLEVTSDNGYTGKISPGQITIRNNIFYVTKDGPSSGAMMTFPPDGDHYNNIYAGWSPSGTLGPGEIKVTDPGLSSTYRLVAGSPAIDKGSTKVLTTWTDYDGNAVPLGAGPDIGCSEFCDGQDCKTASATSGAGGTSDSGSGGSTSASGGTTSTAATTGGSTSAAGGTTSTSATTTGGSSTSSGGTATSSSSAGGNTSAGGSSTSATAIGGTSSSAGGSSSVAATSGGTQAAAGGRTSSSDSSSKGGASTGAGGKASSSTASGGKTSTSSAGGSTAADTAADSTTSNNVGGSSSNTGSSTANSANQSASTAVPVSGPAPTASGASTQPALPESANTETGCGCRTVTQASHTPTGSMALLSLIAGSLLIRRRRRG